MGDVEGAVKALNKLNPQKLNDRLRNVMAANIGLCAFRSGKVQEGLAAYRRAIEGFMKMHAPAESASARAYLAREAAMAGLPEAGKLLVEAEDALRPFKTAEAQLIIRRLRGEDVDAQLANARQAQEQAKKLARLRAITWTTPGLPGKEGVVGRLLL
ncbi:MAG: hypothetical protein C0522_14465 [Rhodocyclaceae bacterium]|nr:hypothetical protein [Rhodocyclaceae bacterium]